MRVSRCRSVLAWSLRCLNSMDLQTERMATMTARNQHRLLVVEDDKDLLYIEMKSLEMAGYQVDGAYNVTAALRRLDCTAYDAVLTDLVLPERSGNHLIAEACERNVPCIAITANQWDPIAQVALEIGCDTLITKPFKSAQLVQAVERVIEGDGAGANSPRFSPAHIA